MTHLLNFADTVLEGLDSNRVADLRLLELRLNSDV